ncbi:hypothetical protein GCM10010156_49970 [Planobispora rosea]|uniref:Uncharacterized protein n=1 Tax=Planobispora rosea TaxID=35762 RepID=A0A8J3RUP4_PLARO|nr:hypothetical protein [Planobispora rosea]GGS85427.1 hypothetical protein GCM10010156_49970 [Planobispora rosea]GIH83396.1 hypothetical protein Pro02_18040 [Planobispora rosea]
MTGTAGSGTHRGEPRILRVARYAVEVLAFAATLVIAYLVWG